jgi:hypothetical protein
VEYLCKENGVTVVDYSTNGPYVIHEADEFECPSCHHVVIVGFGDGPFARRGDTDFVSAMDEASARGGRRNNFIDAATHAIHKVAE